MLPHQIIPMGPFLKRAFKITFGWLLVVLGVIGIILPILHGMIFLVGGLLVLSTEYVWADRLLSRLKARFPKVGALIVAAQQKLRVSAPIPTAPQPGAAD